MKKKRKPKIPESRKYTHLECGQVTEVDGMHFRALADPFSVTWATFCCSCETHFPLDEFEWEDTGERISDQRERLRSYAPEWARIWCTRTGCIIYVILGLVLGLMAGFGLGQIGGAMKWIGPVVCSIAGIIAGFVVMSVVSDSVMHRYYKIED